MVKSHIHGTVAHSHDRGTMEIEGDIWLGGLSGRSYNLVVNNGNGALQPSGYGTVDPAYPAEHHAGYGAIHLKASDGWSGSTSTAAPNTLSNNDYANENRPENFTVKIWKRTA